MDALQVVLAAAGLLLVASGVWKLARPDEARRALRAVGLPSSPWVVRSIGGAEIAAGAGALFGDARWWGVAVAALYAGFAMFILVALWRRAPLRSCGCFGERGTSPTPLHVAIDAGVSAAALLAALDAVDAPLDAVRAGGTDATVLVLGSLALAAALYFLLTRVDLSA